MKSLIFKIENRLKHNRLAQKLFFWTKLRTDFPIALNIEPTNHCNLRCYFCPQGMGKVVRPKGFMEMGLYKKIINELRSKPKLWQLFLNKDGEPFLHPKILEMIKIAKNVRVAYRVEIFTNGVVLTEKIAKGLIETELDVLHISIDAFLGKTFKKIKGKDCLLQIKESVLKLMDLKRKLGKKLPVVEVKMVVTDINKDEKEDFFNYWRGRVDQVKVYPLHEWEGTARKAKSKEQRAIRQLADKIQKEKKFTNHKSPARLEAAASAANRARQITNHRWPCVVPFYNPAINWDGKVTSCCVNYRDNGLIFGDVNKQSLQEIWDGKKYKKLRKDLLSGDLEDWPTCKKCSYWELFSDMSIILKIKN